MQMDMLVERRAKPVLKRDRSKPGTGLPGEAGACRNACRVTKQPFNLAQKNLRQRHHRLWAVSQDAAEPLQYGDHPLPNWDRRNDGVCQVRSRLSHPATGAGRTATAALARERNQEALATATAPRPRKPRAEQPAGKLPAELRPDMAGDWLPVRIMLGQPALDQSITKRGGRWATTTVEGLYQSSGTRADRRWSQGLGGSPARRRCR